MFLPDRHLKGRQAYALVLALLGVLAWGFPGLARGQEAGSVKDAASTADSSPQDAAKTPADRGVTEAGKDARRDVGSTVSPGSGNITGQGIIRQPDKGCSNCSAPGGSGPGPLELLFSLALLVRLRRRRSL